MRQLPHEILLLSPLNFEMPCLAIADNPRNPRWRACVPIIVSLSQDATFESIRTDFACDKRYSKLFNLKIALIYISVFLQVVSWFERNARARRER